MSKYVPDISSNRWVIISQSRIARPDNNHTKHLGKKECPFCEGNEHMSPNELYRVGEGEEDKRGWKVRVISNKYPITDFHEVIIHSPHEDDDIESLPLKQVELIFQTYRQRFNFHKKKGQVLIFCNHGEHAGASIRHPHSQLVVIPFQINMDALSREPLSNVVDENKFFHVYCPDFSQWPYEVWITPKKEGGLFGDLIDEEVADLSEIVQRMLARLKKMYNEGEWSTLPFGYNYYFYPKENWYLRIIPRFVHRAGFELGTGLSVNVVDPLDASLELRGVERKVIGVLKKLKKY
ncbi:MAG: DUF4931 domain-containing protein [bacterium]|nr:DUF4931 domain-containing protein [bacterium]